VYRGTPPDAEAKRRTPRAGRPAARTPLSSLVLAVALATLPRPGAAAEQCSADCTHPTRACVCAVDASRVVFTPIGGIDPQPAQLGQALDPGDEIASPDPDAVVSVSCPASAAVKLHGRFRAVILPPAEGKDCAFNLLAGEAHVLTPNPTELTAGETLMGSRRTMYSMRVATDATVQCTVFDGLVDVHNLRTGAVRLLGTNATTSWRAGQLLSDISPIARADLVRATRIYARSDVARVRSHDIQIDDPGAFERALQSSYATVLTAPDDAAARIALAVLQTSARLPTPALYHLQRAETSPMSQDQQAAVAATRWMAYKQLGREQEAAGQAEKLRTMDPARYKVLQQLDPMITRVDPRVYRRVPAPLPDAPAITAVADPPVVAAGAATTIAVTATAAGQPIGGAKVVLSSVGGTFPRSGRTRLEGQTDASGAFRAEWRCQPCIAVGYQIDVEVFPAGTAPVKTSVAVRTR
jgi:hypothetical protein